MKKGCPYGSHRVLEPKGVLPQPAMKIDNRMELYDNEILIDVKTLNIDAASFTQIKKAAEGDEEKIKEIMLQIVATRGKHHNPVTGSGGMLIGTIEKIGKKLEGTTPLKVGDKIATLVSLSLTPLRIDEIIKIHKEKDQVEIKGKAILFESGIYSLIPSDLPENLVLSLLDVAGAPAQTEKLVKAGDRVLVIGGGGKSGMLCLAEARKKAGETGQVICVGPTEVSFQHAHSLNLAHTYLVADAGNAVEMREKVEAATAGEMADVVINCVNVSNTEMGSILSARENGLVYFFSMATSFTKAALGAEGVGKDITMIIGNGYTRGHSEKVLNMVRENPALRAVYESLYS